MCTGLALLIAASVAAAADTPPPPAASSAPEALLPAGPGRDPLVRSCAVCHPIERVVAERRSIEQWDAMIARMVGLGAQASDEEQQEIFEYLVQFFSTDGR